MDTKQIPFNYFYKMFIDENRKTILEKMWNKIVEDDYELCDIFSVSNEELLKNYNKSLWNVCMNYISLADSKIIVLPQNAIEFVNSILDEIEENKYKESFLMSLQFIYQQYFESLDLGSPILMSSDDEVSPSYFKITLDSQYKISNFDSTNMNLLEQTKTMTKVLTMASEHQQGPIPKTVYCIRKDI